MNGTNQSLSKPVVLMVIVPFRIIRSASSNPEQESIVNDTVTVDSTPLLRRGYLKGTLFLSAPCVPRVRQVLKID